MLPRLPEVLGVTYLDLKEALYDVALLSPRLNNVSENYIIMHHGRREYFLIIEGNIFIH